MNTSTQSLDLRRAFKLGRLCKKYNAPLYKWSHSPDHDIF